MSSEIPRYVYKAFTAEQWQNRQETTELPGAPIDIRDGYIHLSTAVQLARTLELYFAGQKNVQILALATEKIAPNLRWEPSRGGEMFPHLYAPMKKSDIEWQTTLDVPAKGKCRLPDEIVRDEA